MADNLRLYDVVVNGNATRMWLTEDDARTIYGDRATEVWDGANAETKQKTPQNKSRNPDGGK